MRNPTRALQLCIVGLAFLALIPSTRDVAFAANVDNVHPRIFFYADSIDVIRARAIGGPNQAIYETFASLVDQADTENTGYMYAFAAMYQLTQNPNYANTAIDMAVRAVNEGTGGLCYGQGTMLGQMSKLVLTYDWCYDRMTQSQRQLIQNCMMDAIEFIPDGYRQAYNDYSWQYKFVLAHDTSNDVAVQEGLDISIEYLLTEIIPCYDQLKPNGAQDGYRGKYYSLMLTVMETLKHSGNLDVISECSAMQNSWSYWTTIYRPDGQLRRLTDKWNPTAENPAAYFAWQGSRLGSRRAQSLANMLVDEGDYGMGTSLYLLLWYNPDLPADPLGAENVDWYDPYGWYVGRTGWNFGDGSTDITTFFNIKPRMGPHQGALHFDINRGIDDLITKNAYYEGDIDLHFNPWLTQAQAFNTILIYDPSEDFGTYTHNTYNHGPTTRPIPNAGQQGHYDRDEAMALWPSCTWVNGTGYDGWMTEPVTTDVRNAVGGSVAKRTRIVADATVAYSPSKASLVKRTWQWQRPEWFFVKDQVVLEKDGLPVKSLLHCVNRPELDITPTTIRGDWSRGGVFSAPIDQTVVLDNGNSSARLYVLMATGEGMAGNELRIIGGKSINNETWRQNQMPGDFGYVSSPDAISYEFYLEQTGENYMPSDSWRVRDEDIGRRHNPTHLAGDWRVEITVNGARDEVNIAYLVHVTERNAPVADVALEWLGDTLWARVSNGGEDLMFTVCDNCQGMGHQ